LVSVTIEPPPFASRPPRPAARAPLVVAVLVAVFASGVGLGFWLGRRTAPAAPPPAAGSEPAAAPASALPPEPGAAALPAPVPAPASPAPASPPAPAPSGAAAGVRRISVALAGALEDSIAAALPPADRDAAGALAQVVNRLLVWDLHVARDGLRGDRLEVVWSPAAPGGPVAEPVVEALRYASAKLGRTVAAYRYAPAGASPRYYRADGTELEARLVDGPIRDYDQVTSLLSDGRGHEGVDFRAPTGTPVYAPFDAVVWRRNWNFASNGSCLDLRDPRTGHHALFLHLDVLPKDLPVGRRVRKGERVASSGNSGHSFAPHLHYQLEAADGRVLDPFTVHKTERRALDAAALPAFEAARARLDALLGG
jgi:hypothetical protein